MVPKVRYPYDSSSQALPMQRDFWVGRQEEGAEGL